MSATTYREAKHWHRILNFGHNLTYLPIDTPLHGPHNANTPENKPCLLRNHPNPSSQQSHNQTQPKFANQMMMGALTHPDALFHIHNTFHHIALDVL